jgi:cystathionine beta-lyase
MTSAASSPFESLTLEQLRTRTSAKWRFFEPDVLPLWVAEMDVPLAECVIEAVERAMREGDTGYPANNPYGEAHADFAAERFGWNLDPSFSYAITDVMSGVDDLINTLSEPGAPVVTTPPVYGPFDQHVKRLGRPQIFAQLNDAGRLDMASLEEAFGQVKTLGKGGVFLLSNPHNPTGVSHTRDELQLAVELANRFGVRIVSDEIHAALQMPGHTFTPILTLDGADDAFALTSASKAFNLAGIKAALVIAGSNQKETMTRMKANNVAWTSHLGVIAHTAAYRGGGQWLDAVLAGLDSNRRFFAEQVATLMPKAKFLVPEATYLGWLDLSAYDVPADPAPLLREKGRVAFSPAEFFGLGSEGHVRVNLATNHAILREAAERTAAVVTSS